MTYFLARTVYRCTSLSRLEGGRERKQQFIEHASSKLIILIEIDLL